MRRSRNSPLDYSQTRTQQLMPRFTCRLDGLELQGCTSCLSPCAARQRPTGRKQGDNDLRRNRCLQQRNQAPKVSQDCIGGPPIVASSRYHMLRGDTTLRAMSLTARAKSRGPRGHPVDRRSCHRTNSSVNIVLLYIEPLNKAHMSRLHTGKSNDVIQLASQRKPFSSLQQNSC